MGERRALLDPDMYKISEEDSQDEEVLASLTYDINNIPSNPVVVGSARSSKSKGGKLGPISIVSKKKNRQNIDTSIFHHQHQHQQQHNSTKNGGDGLSVTRGNVNHRPQSTLSDVHIHIYQQPKQQQQQRTSSGGGGGKINSTVEWPSDDYDSDSTSNDSGSKSKRHGSRRHDIISSMPMKVDSKTRSKKSTEAPISYPRKTDLVSTTATTTTTSTTTTTYSDDDDDDEGTSDSSCSDCDCEHSSDHESYYDTELDYEEEASELVTEKEIISRTNEKEGNVFLVEAEVQCDVEQIPCQRQQPQSDSFAHHQSPVESSSFSLKSKRITETNSTAVLPPPPPGILSTTTTATPLSPQKSTISSSSSSTMKRTNSSDFQSSNGLAKEGRTTRKGGISKFLKAKKKDRGKHKKDDGEGVGHDSENHAAVGGLDTKHKSSEGRCDEDDDDEQQYQDQGEDEGRVQVVDVLLSFSSKGNLGRRASLCELLLGIIPGRLSIPRNGNSTRKILSRKRTAASKKIALIQSANTTTTTTTTTTTVAPGSSPDIPRGETTTRVSVASSVHIPAPSTSILNQHNQTQGGESMPEKKLDNRLIIAGFLPDGPTMKNPNIRVGNWLQSINGIPVNCTTVDSVLSSIIETETQFMPQSENFANYNPQQASFYKDLKITVHLTLKNLDRTQKQQQCQSDKNKVNERVDNVGGFGGNNKQMVTLDREERGEEEEEEENEKNPTTTSVHLTSLSSIHNTIPERLLQSLAVIFISTSTSSASIPDPSPWSNNNNNKNNNNHNFEEEDCEASTSTLKEETIDVVFSWPKKTRSRKVEPLVASHGMFSTLYKLLRDVTGSHPVMSQVKIDGELTDISYVSDNNGEDLLLVAVGEGIVGQDGSRISAACLSRFAERLRKSLVFKYGSLSRAFRVTVEKEMVRFLSNAMIDITDTSCNDFLFLNEVSPHRFVPKTIQMGIEEILYSLEGSDFYEEIRRYPSTASESLCHFHCLGSILFFKSKLVISHMEKDVQTQFYSWWMTELNKWGNHATWTQLRRLILWQPSFLFSRGSHLTGREDRMENVAPSCHYAVLVGLDYFLLGFILEPITPCQKFAKPDTLWIRKGVQALIQLVRSDASQYFHFGIEGVPDRVAIASSTTDNVMAGNHNDSSTTKKPTKNERKGGSGNVAKNVDSQSKPTFLSSTNPLRQNANSMKSLIDEFEASHLLETDGKAKENQDEEDGGATGSDASSFKLNGDRSDTASADRPYLHVGGFSPTSTEMLTTVSICKGNLIYEFIQVEYGRGVLVSTDQQQDSIFSEILKNFRHNTILSHEILHKAANARRKLGNRVGDWKWVSKALTPVSEHGSLFECQVQDLTNKKKKRMKKLSYWVIGRLYEDLREIYICLQDTMEHHNIVELAFKIAHVTGEGSNVSTNNNTN